MLKAEDIKVGDLLRYKRVDTTADPVFFGFEVVVLKVIDNRMLRVYCDRRSFSGQHVYISDIDNYERV